MTVYLAVTVTAVTVTVYLIGGRVLIVRGAVSEAAYPSGKVKHTVTVYPSEGTAVELWLPQSPEPTLGGDGRARHVPDRLHGAGSILLCEDDDEVRLLLAGFLTSAGYRVIEADGPSAALRILEGAVEIDLLIVDYAMPGMNGLETIRRARLTRPSLRSLLITGYAGVQGSGDIPLLRKPFAPDQLATRVAEILAGPPAATVFGGG